MSKKRLYDWAEIVSALAMSAPAQRIVLVRAWATGYDVRPVLAILAKQSDHYRCAVSKEGQSARRAPSRDEMESLGWRYQHSGTFFDVVVNDENFGLSEWGSLAEHAYVNEVEIVVCDWPQSEDAEKLAPVIEKLQANWRAKRIKEEQEEAARGTVV